MKESILFSYILALVHQAKRSSRPPSSLIYKQASFLRSLGALSPTLRELKGSGLNILQIIFFNSITELLMMSKNNESTI